MGTLYEIRNLKCSYDKHFVPGESKVVMDIRHLDIPKGKKVFIVGESGIGKSTVLEVLGLMNNTLVSGPGSKFVFHDGDGSEHDLLGLWASGRDDTLSSFRLKHFSFIFQSTNLMRNFTAIENIAVTRMLQGYSAEESYSAATGIVNDLGLPDLGRERMAQELSGGQQQRLAFARAVLPDFSVLFGDEPTGNLDPDNAERVMAILAYRLDRQEGSTAIIVSHDMHLAVSFADVVIKIRKERSASSDYADDSHSFGVIDTSCLYARSDDRQIWSNGVDSYSPGDFELFLKKTEAL